MVQEAGLTPALAGSLFTIEVIVEVPFAPTVLTLADKETVIATNVMPTDPVFVESIAEVAEIVTCKSLAGEVEGAV